MDELAMDKVIPFEKLLYQKMDTNHKNLTDLIIKDKELTPHIEKEIEALIKEVYEEITRA